MYTHERVDSMPKDPRYGSKYQWLFDLVNATVGGDPVRVLFPDQKTLERHRAALSAHYSGARKYRGSKTRIRTAIKPVDESGFYLYIQAHDGR